MRHNYLLWWLAGFTWLSQGRAVLASSSPPQPEYYCPGKCSHFETNPWEWTSLGHQDLAKCNQPLLFGFTAQNQVAHLKTQDTIRACVPPADEDETPASLAVKPRDTSAGPVLSFTSSCGPPPSLTPTIVYTGSRSDGPSAAANPNDVSAAARQLAEYMQNRAPCGTTQLFAKVGDSVLGLYSGAEIDRNSAAELLRLFQQQALDGAQTFQVCEPGAGAARTFGLYAGSMTEMKDVQTVTTAWGGSECPKSAASIPLHGINVGFLPATHPYIPADHPRSTGEIAARQAAQCSPSDATYSSEDMPTGSYMRLADIDSLPSGRQYITIVNLTPHRFRLESTHSYQMDVFDWGDIPPGRARQNIAHYTERSGANHVDDNGEAYYTIDGTSKKFTIRATTHIPDSHSRRTVVDLTDMGLGQREYLDPAPNVPVTLVITGSDSYGFIASINYQQGNWMRQIYDVIQDRSIRHVVMPGSHDAGMSTISNRIVSLGIAANTQTQGLNIYNQLRAGSRWLDLRIMSVHPTGSATDYSFWVAHVNDETADIPVGNTGESLDDVINEINQFTSENPGEAIFIRVRYLVGIRRFPSGGPIYWTNDIAGNFFTQLKKVTNRCPDLDTTVKFQNQRAAYFMDRNDGAGCVIFLLVGDHLPSGVQRASVPDGLYPADQMTITDNWSNLADTQPVAEDQIADWSGIQRSAPFSNDQFLISQWLVSADAVTTTALSIQKIGVLPTNPSLYWAGVNGMSPTKWPNVLLVDYVGVVVPDQFAWEQLGAELYTLAIGLNLYMISENCDVSTQRSPLLAPVASTRSLRNGTAQAWNGVIFANGTVFDHPPGNLHLGRVAILKKGTVFGNGSVLLHDIPNPNYSSTWL